MWINVNGSLPDRAANDLINSPTRAEVNRMRERRLDLLAKAAAILAADPSDSDERAYNLDTEAFDIECDLRLYGHEL